MNINNLKRRGKTFYSLFFSFLITALLPLSILITISLRINNSMRRDNLYNNWQLMEVICQELDNDIRRRIEIANYLMANRAVKRLIAGIDETVNETQESLREIAGFIFGASAERDSCSLMSVYIPQRNLMVTSTTANLKPNDFYKIFLNFKNISSDEFFQYIKDSPHGFRADMYSENSILGNERYLIYAQPIYIGYTLQKAFLITFFNTAKIHALLTQNLPNGGYYQVFAPDSSILLSSPELEHAEFSSVIGRYDRFNNQFEWEADIDGQHFIGFSINKVETGLQYVFYLPEAHVYDQLFYWQYLLIGLVGMGLFVSIFLAYGLSRQLYSPLKHLIYKLYPNGIPKRGAEYNLLSQKFDETIIQNKKFNDEIRSHYLRMRNDALLRLLIMSGSMDENDILSLQLDNNLTFEYLRFHVVLLRCCPQMDIELTGVTQCLLSMDEKVLIINDSPPDNDYLQPLIIFLNTIQQDNPSMQIAVSSECNHISGLSVCFREASAVLSIQQFEIPKTPYYNFDSFSQKYIIYPLDKEVQLISGLRKGDYTACELALNEIKILNEERNLNSEAMFILFQNMISTIYRAYESLSFDNKIIKDEKNEDKLFIKEQNEYLNRIKKVDHPPGNQLFEQILELYHYICELNTKNQKVKNERIITQVIQYINDHHSDSNLSLDVISQRFNVSYYYLSRMFSDVANRSFYDTLNKCRIQHAVNLLTETNNSVQEIANEVGYTNDNTFFRAFRKEMGTSPKKYRELTNKK